MTNLQPEQVRRISHFINEQTSSNDEIVVMWRDRLYQFCSFLGCGVAELATLNGGIIANYSLTQRQFADMVLEILAQIPLAGGTYEEEETDEN